MNYFDRLINMRINKDLTQKDLTNLNKDMIILKKEEQSYLLRTL